VLDLRSEIGIPHTLAGLEVDDSRLDEIAAMAVVDPTAGGNPVTLTEDGVRQIFRAALRG
jgi:alcohol dehydrogenase class IV